MSQRACDLLPPIDVVMHRPDRKEAGQRLRDCHRDEVVRESRLL
jgi:hypothetical protein